MNNKHRGKDLRVYVKNTAHSIQSGITTFLDFLFPAHNLERKVRKLTVEELASRVSMHVSKDRIIAIFPYRDPLIKRMIWLLKYKGNSGVIELLGQITGEHLTDILADEHLFENFKDPLLIPIPLSLQRKRERGFNQVERIAECIQNNFGHLCTLEKKILKKKKETVPQTSLSRNQRLQNVTGVFDVNSQMLNGRNIILLDDVTTTGSTLREARKEILRGGARKVLCLAIAY